MIKSKDIDIEITGHNRRFYTDVFPNVVKGDVITINQLQISARSTINVECICENCGITFARLRRNIQNENTFCTVSCKGIYHKTKNNIDRKNNILRSVERRILEGKSVRYNDIKEDDINLFYSIDKYYPLNEILSDLGFTEQEAVDNLGLTRNINKKTLSIENIIDRLNYLESLGRLTTSAMRTEFEDLRLETSIKKIFGSVEQCFNELGYERDITSNNILIQMGRQFESVFKEILNELNIKFDYQKPLPNGSIPDFKIKHSNLIIDTKLSSWTTSIFEDIEKYSPYCEKLIFVYLREGTVIPKYKDNVELVSVKTYLSFLGSGRKTFYEEKLKNILSYHP